MKRIAVGFVLAGALSLAADVRIGVNGGYARALTTSYGEGVSYGISAAVDIFRFLAVEVRATRFSLTGDGASDALSKGRLTSLPVEVALQARISLGSTVTPYLAVGAGYSWNSFKVDSALSGAWFDVGFSMSESVKNGPVGLAALGFDFFLRPWLALNIEGRILLTEAKGSWSMTDAATGARATGSLNSLSWNSALAGMSLKWIF
jgi:hypothetical protein